MEKCTEAKAPHSKTSLVNIAYPVLQVQKMVKMMFSVSLSIREKKNEVLGKMH